MFRRLSIGAVALVTGVNLTVPLHAQTAAPTVGQQRQNLPPISVTAKKHEAAKTPIRATRPAHAPVPVAPTPPPTTTKIQLHPILTPRRRSCSDISCRQESFSITAKQIEETINLKDPEDAIKYFPSLFVRKRNDGDNQAVLATRSWGLNSSARTLIYTTICWSRR